ncbi:MAG: hypothetical protein KDB22_15925, partial [Planctomycetales bacterium]|nr:hypothetical protein [Planctomycetales bacterium]
REGYIPQSPKVRFLGTVHPFGEYLQHGDLKIREETTDLHWVNHTTELDSYIDRAERVVSQAPVWRVASKRTRSLATYSPLGFRRVVINATGETQATPGRITSDTPASEAGLA